MGLFKKNVEVVEETNVLIQRKIDRLMKRSLWYKLLLGFLIVALYALIFYLAYNLQDKNMDNKELIARIALISGLYLLSLFFTYWFMARHYRKKRRIARFYEEIYGSLESENLKKVKEVDADVLSKRGKRKVLITSIIVLVLSGFAVGIYWAKVGFGIEVIIAIVLVVTLLFNYMFFDFLRMKCPFCHRLFSVKEVGYEKIGEKVTCITSEYFSKGLKEINNHEVYVEKHKEDVYVSVCKCGNCDGETNCYFFMNRKKIK